MQPGKRNLSYKPKISRKKKRLLLFTVAAIIFIFALVFSVNLASTFGSFHNDAQWAQSLRQQAADNEVVYLLYGVDYWGANPYVERFVLVHHNTLNNKINLIYIPGNTMVETGEWTGEPLGQLYRRLLKADFIELVQDLSGMPVHHYFELHYKGITVLGDYLGGIVSESLPEGPGEALLPQGEQLLNGFELYRYFIIADYQDSSETQINRQRSVLLQLWNKLDNLSFYQWPRALRAASPYFETDLSWRELKALVGEIEQYDYTDVNSILLPGQEEVINGALLWVIEPQGIVNMMRMLDEGYLVNPGEVTIEVLNGSGILGLATKAADALKAQGYTVINIGNADHFDYEETRVIALGSKVDKARIVALHLPDSSMLHEQDPGATVDVRVIIGRNYNE